MRNDEEWRFRGPSGHLHLPRWNKNCYYRRESACTLCWMRLLWGVCMAYLRTRRRRGERE